MTRRKTPSLLLSAAALALAATVAAAAPPAALTAAADPAHPTVVELYESQGCSDCPPANANVNALAGRPDILALNFAVTYWDQLGWKDTFAKPAYTARQWDYAHAAGRAQVATPQVVVNGATATVVGANPQNLARAIHDHARGVGGPQIGTAGDAVTIGADRTGGAGAATVWLVQYDPRNLVVPIRAGENGGATLPHRNIVRALTSLGTWNGAAVRFTVPAPADRAYRNAVLVQQGKGGRIVAAARI